MDILEFADVIDKRIEITYFPNQKGRFCARFAGCDTTDGMFLRGEHGNSSCPIRAIERYSQLIAGKTIVFNPMSDNRQEFVAPASFDTI